MSLRDRVSSTSSRTSSIRRCFPSVSQGIGSLSHFQFPGRLDAITAAISLARQRKRSGRSAMNCSAPSHFPGTDSSQAWMRASDGAFEAANQANSSVRSRASNASCVLHSSSSASPRPRSQSASSFSNWTCSQALTVKVVRERIASRNKRRVFADDVLRLRCNASLGGAREARGVADRTTRQPSPGPSAWVKNAEAVVVFPQGQQPQGQSAQ